VEGKVRSDANHPAQTCLAALLVGTERRDMLGPRGCWLDFVTKPKTESLILLFHVVFYVLQQKNEIYFSIIRKSIKKFVSAENKNYIM